MTLTTSPARAFGARQFLNCPATEAHERHMAEIAKLASAESRRLFIAKVTKEEGRFLGKWLADDFADQFKAKQGQRSKRT
jgi:hypothetical protein